MTTQGFIAYHGVAKGGARDLLKTGFSGPRQAPHGIHLGGLEQARMRAGGGVVFAVEVLVDAGGAPFRRVRDQVGDWRATVARAVRAGVPGLVYLNRYEGIPTAAILRLHGHDQDHGHEAISSPMRGDGSTPDPSSSQHASSQHASSQHASSQPLSTRRLSGVDLDSLSDHAFLRLVPEARDSWVILDPALVRIIGPA